MKRALRFAAATGIAAGGLLTGVGVGPAQAGPTHVAIVIAGVKTACVPWYSGMTGSDVLTAAAKVIWGNPGTPQAGMVLYIDGVGASTTSEHYWSYWESSTSGWAYSSWGPDSTTPKPGTVEGWHFTSTSGDPQPPPAASYASICPDVSWQAPVTTAPAPVPPPTTTHASVPTSAGQSAVPRTPPAPTGAPSDATTARAALPTTTTVARRPTTRPRASRPPVRSSSTPAAMAAPGSTPAAPASSPSTSPAASSKRSSPTGAIAGTAIGLTAAAAIGGLAYWRMRTQGGAE